jgi:hypothetical protein
MGSGGMDPRERGELYSRRLRPDRGPKQTISFQELFLASSPRQLGLLLYV